MISSSWSTVVYQSVLLCLPPLAWSVFAISWMALQGLPICYWVVVDGICIGRMRVSEESGDELWGEVMVEGVVLLLPSGIISSSCHSQMDSFIIPCPSPLSASIRLRREEAEQQAMACISAGQATGNVNMETVDPEKIGPSAPGDHYVR
ncbi:hypothetical protein Tco_0140242 [Tanacetum coccineum]